MDTNFREKIPKIKSGSKALDEDLLQEIHDKAVELMDEEKYEESFKEFEKILDNGPKSAEGDDPWIEWYEDALYHQFEILSELGENKKALEKIDSLLRRFPKEPDYLLGKGFVLDDLERHEEALECYKEMLKIVPDDEDAFTNMSGTLIDLGKFKDAVEYADKAIKIDSKNDDAWYNKGEALLNLGEYKNALNCFENVMEVDRTDDETWYMKARCLSNLDKNEDEILDALLVACSLEPEKKIELKESLSFESLKNNDRFKKIIK